MGSARASTSKSNKPALSRFEEKLPEIAETLQKIADDDPWDAGNATGSGSDDTMSVIIGLLDHWNTESRQAASGLVGSIANFQFIVVLFTLRCWYVTHGLCVALQGSALDIAHGYGIVSTVLARLQQMRTDIDKCCVCSLACDCKVPV